MAKLGCASGSVVVVGLGGNREVTVRHWKASETSKFCQTWVADLQYAPADRGVREVYWMVTGTKLMNT